MSSYVGSKLILVEGLTGSGKSIMAHWIARQLQHSGTPAAWVHEAELPHPLGLEDDPGPENFGVYARQQWAAYAKQVAHADHVSVVEACLFNNVFEWLFAQDRDRHEILAYADEMQTVLEPLNPTLVYLVQADVDAALARNFERRGPRFRDFVIQYATDTPIAKQRGWTGYAGMATFWREFVALADEIYARYHIRKCRIDNAAGHWDDYNRQVLACLSLPLVPERRISHEEAMPFVGVYQDRKSDREFTVRYEDGKLTMDLFLETRTNLVWRADNVFVAEGWHFEIRFASNGSNEATVLSIGGSDVDYVSLVGTVADKNTTAPTARTGSDNESVTIREYEDPDLDELLQAWYSASQISHPFLDGAFFDLERQNIATLYLPNAETWVYELNGVVVGFISLMGNEVGGLFVDARFHRRGIGGALMNHVRRIRDVLELDVFEQNLVGRAFYQKYGFTLVDQHVHEETGFMLLRLRLIC